MYSSHHTDPIVLSRNTDKVYNIIDSDNGLNLEDKELEDDVAGLFRIA